MRRTKENATPGLDSERKQLLYQVDESLLEFWEVEGQFFLHSRHGCTKRLPGRQTMGTGTKTNRTMKQVQCRAEQPPGCRKFRMLSVVLLLTRGSLHCIVPNDEIMKFNKWSVVKFIFHRLVRYHCFPDV